MTMTPEEKKSLFRTAKRKVVYQATHFTYIVDEITSSSGTVHTYDSVVHPGASVIIPIDDDGGLILVRQYRNSIDAFTYELPAGKIDKGEDPETTAIRECQEEIGKYPGNLQKLFETYPSPAYSTEILHFYLATQLTDKALAQDELEAIDVHCISLEEALRWIKEGKITDAKTALGIFYYEKMC